jgi:TetR/AcrR family transcriptional regulator
MMAQPDGGSSATLILSNALKLFADQGYAATSIQQIAQASGVSKAGVFHHYRTKRDLYLAALDSAQEEFAGELEELPVAVEPCSRLRILMGVHLDYVLRNPDVARLVVRELLRVDLGGDERAALGQALGRNYERIARALEPSGPFAGTPVGRTRDAALLLLAANLVYLLLEEFLDDLEGSPGRNRAEFVRRMSRVIFSGIDEEGVS